MIGRALSHSKILEGQSFRGTGTICRAVDLMLDREAAFHASRATRLELKHTFCIHWKAGCDSDREPAKETKSPI